MATAKKRIVKRAKGKKVTKKTAKKKAKKAAPRKKTAKRKTAKKAKKAPKRKAAKRKAAPKKKVARAKRKPNPAFMRPMTPSIALSAIVGAKAMPRTEITKRVWDYIKKNRLQDTVNKRMINADDNLRRVFSGKSKVNMFEMTKLINAHLS